MKCKCLKCTDCIPVAVDNATIIFSTDHDFAAFHDDNTNWTELTINGCVDVPEAKPSIAAIDSVHSEIQITSSKVVVAPSFINVVGNNVPVENEEGKITTGRKLIIEGLICYVIQYVANDCEHSVHSFEGQVPFSAYIVLPATLGTPPVDTLELFFNITGFVENTMVKTACERNVCLCTTFILQPTPTAVEICANEIIDDSGLACSLQRSSDAQKVKSCCGCNCSCSDIIIQGVSTPSQIDAILTSRNDNLWTEFFIPELLSLPFCKPDIAKIVSVTSKFEIVCQKVVATPKAIDENGNPVPNFEGLKTTGRKLVIEGMLRQRITYISCTETKSLHSAHFDVPVSTFIILPEEAKLTDRYKLSTVIEDIFICALNERQIFKNTTLFIKATELTCN